MSVITLSLHGEVDRRSSRSDVKSPGAYCPRPRWIVPVIQMSCCDGKVFRGGSAAAAAAADPFSSAAVPSELLQIRRCGVAQQPRNHWMGGTTPNFSASMRS